MNAFKRQMLISNVNFRLCSRLYRKDLWYGDRNNFGRKTNYLRYEITSYEDEERKRRTKTKNELRKRNLRYEITSYKDEARKRSTNNLRVLVIDFNNEFHFNLHVPLKSYHKVVCI